MSKSNTNVTFNTQSVESIVEWNEPKDQEGIFKCTSVDCHKEYTNKYSLWRHLATHKTDRKFICDHCGRRFALAQYLKDHINVHTGERPYVCKIEGCHEAFSQAGKLSQHARLHNQESLCI
jgi:uncharacterized Zn-finger protein